MSKYKLIMRSLTSPSVIYVILRYLTYLLQFGNALLLAKILGEHEYGIYCFALLIMQYMSYSNLGLNESLNIEYAAYIHNETEAQRIWNNTWSINIIINCALFLVCIPILWIVRPFEEYHFSGYSEVLLLTCVLFNLVRIYMTYNKLFGKLWKLNLQQLLPHLLVLLAIILLHEGVNTKTLVTLTGVAHLISLIVFRIHLYKPPRFQIDIACTKILIRRGVNLLLYNLSFYLMTLVASSLVSQYFSVEEFGCYSFSNTMVNGIVMSGGAFMFIVSPKILNRLTHYSTSESVELINRLRSVYVVFMDFVSLMAISASIFLTWFLPQYKDNLTVVFSLLMIGQVCNNSTAGYASLIIAKKKEACLVRFALTSVLITFALSTLLMQFFDSLFVIPGVVCVSSMVYSIQVIRYGCKLLRREDHNPLLEFLVYNKWIPLILIPLNACFINNTWFLIFILLLYIVVNYRNIRNAVVTGVLVLSNKEMLKL